MATSIEMRRRIRALEAKRDKLVEVSAKSKSELTKVRAELKHVRGLRK